MQMCYFYSTISTDGTLQSKHVKAGPCPKALTIYNSTQGEVTGGGEDNGKEEILFRLFYSLRGWI